MLATTEYPEGYKLIEKFQSDTAKELMLENAEDDEDSPFDVEITDDSIIYGYDEETSNFNRGFWINTECDDEEEFPLSNLLSVEKEFGSDNTSEEEE